MNKKILNHFNGNIKEIINFFNHETGCFLETKKSKSKIDLILCFENECHREEITQTLEKNTIKTKNIEISLTTIEKDLKKTLSRVSDFKCQVELEKLLDCLKKQLNNNCNECDEFSKIYNDYVTTENYFIFNDTLYKTVNTKNVIIDPLGLYISQDLQSGPTYEGKIIIFCDKILDMAIEKKVDPLSLFEVVLIHELAHAFHHIGLDQNHKINENFYRFDSNICEGFANYMVVERYKDIKIKDVKRSQEMEKALKDGTCQDGAYLKYKNWGNLNYSIMAINHSNNHFRYITPIPIVISCLDYEKEIDDHKLRSNY